MAFGNQRSFSGLCCLIRVKQKSPLRRVQRLRMESLFGLAKPSWTIVRNEKPETIFVLKAFESQRQIDLT